ncbi:A24 family peptidase [Chromobacterium sp. ATCC 53434]|uniref:prepilin peptidase n=1 Tax=Chromobacterium sp. (strain ATCC 53434 / SC 14030) TaxID=2059672 RepID=UPI001F32F533|nr:A24 family peptidase [Chromobacterium sp. ATCC 53434]
MPDKKDLLILGGLAALLTAGFGWLGVSAAEPARAAASLMAIGLLLGSFLNVLVYRLPRMLQADWERECAEYVGQPPPATGFSLARPHSHCPACGNTLRPWQLVPLLGYALLRGRCGFCDETIGIRYPLVELLTGCAFAAIGWRLGFQPAAFAQLALCYLLLALALIDFDSRLLPDCLTQPLLWLGLLANLFHLMVPLTDAVAGAMAGYLSMWGIAAVFRALTGKDGLGQGDFKLVAALGGWLGWSAVPLIIGFGATMSALSGLLLIRAGRLDADQAQPFGPWLIAAGVVAWLWGGKITAWYLAAAGW